MDTLDRNRTLEAVAAGLFLSLTLLVDGFSILSSRAAVAAAAAPGDPPQRPPWGVPWRRKWSSNFIHFFFLSTSSFLSKNTTHFIHHGIYRHQEMDNAIASFSFLCVAVHYRLTIFHQPCSTVVSPTGWNGPVQVVQEKTQKSTAFLGPADQREKK